MFNSKCLAHFIDYCDETITDYETLSRKIIKASNSYMFFGIGYCHGKCAFIGFTYEPGVEDPSYATILFISLRNSDDDSISYTYCYEHSGWKGPEILLHR